MGVPKKRLPKGRRNKRRMHIFLKNPGLTKCLKCGHFVLPHSVCQNCGYYKGKEVIDVLKKLTKKEKKERKKEIAIKEKKEEREEIIREKSLSLEELSKKI